MHLFSALLVMGLFLVKPVLGDEQGLSPAEQRKLLQSVEELKQEVKRLKSQIGQPAPSAGLRTEDYQGQPVDSAPRNHASQGGAEDPKMKAEVLKQLEALKKMEKENAKLLKEIEKEL